MASTTANANIMDVNLYYSRRNILLLIGRVKFLKNKRPKHLHGSYQCFIT